MNLLRIAGIVLITFLACHYLGLPYGLLLGAGVAMLFL